MVPYFALNLTALVVPLLQAVQPGAVVPSTIGAAVGVLRNVFDILPFSIAHASTSGEV